MRFTHPQFLRFFVLLLITVFTAETVYASGMMTVEQVASGLSQSVENTEIHTEHCHDVQSKHLQVQTHEKQQSQANCSHCNHCFACFSMMPQGQFNAIVVQVQHVTATPFVNIYHAPTSAQPQKPPIADAC